MQQILILITFSLISVIGLQLYYAYQVYQQQKLTLKLQLDQTLELSILKAEENRVDEINTYFEQDLRNDELVRIEIRYVEGEQRIALIEPKTGNYHASFSIKDSLVEEGDDLAQILLDRNHTFLKQGAIMYWTSELGNRLNAYNDTVLVDTLLLREYIQLELRKYAVTEPVKLRWKSDSIDLETEPIDLESEWLSIQMEEDTFVQALLPNPNHVILQRMGMVLALTMLVLLFIVVSFITLIRFANHQKRLSQLKDDFIDNVSHELITPVSTLKLAVESLKKDPTLSTNKYLHISEQQTARIENVVDQILKTSFHDSRPVSSFEEIHLDQLIPEIIRYYETTSHKKVVFKFNQDGSALVHFDLDHLTNVLHNVIHNAIKYGPESTVLVSIQVEELEEKWNIKITDNGSGIPGSDHDIIFEKFHRVSKETHDVKGLGIGLYYSREVLNRLGGKIELVSSNKNGSSFVITIPKKNKLHS